MRIVVVSDTHRDFRTLLQIVEKHKGEAAYFLHLGDGEQEVEDVKALYPELPLLAVRGNCDFSGENPETRVATAGNVRIFMAHGHDLGFGGPGRCWSGWRGKTAAALHYMATPTKATPIMKKEFTS